MEWKNIEDGYPKNLGRYMVNIYEDDEIGDFVMIATFTGDCFVANGMVPIANIVTHWMEIPEPPKK